MSKHEVIEDFDYGLKHGELGRLDIHHSQIMVAARWTKPVKWMVLRS